MRIPDYLPALAYERPHYEQDGPREDDPHAAADLELTRKIAGVVDFYYSGQPFFIKVSHHQGVVMIQIPALMGPSNWFVVKIAALKSDPCLRLIVRGCGEILERYNIPRAHYDRDHYVAAINAIPVGRRAYGYVPG